jgi:hypothetical protein
MSEDLIDLQIKEASRITVDEFTIQSEEEEEEEDDADVQRLAASLAPAVEELDALLASPLQADRSRHHPKGNDTSYDDDDDDSASLDGELQRLAASETLLRQELEFAHDFGTLLGSPLLLHHHAEEDPPDLLLPRAQSLLDQNQSIDDDEETQGEEPDIPSSTAETETPTITTMVKPSPSKSTSRHSYTLEDHKEYLQIQTEPRGGWYYLTSLLGNEYILPVPQQALEHLWVGMQPLLEEEERLPFRTTCIPIRPDVLCGAVMDAVMHSLEDDLEICKRQGGHVVMRNASIELNVQLVTSKTTRERALMVRLFYHDAMEPPSENTNDDDDNTQILKLRQAAALVQRLETSRKGFSTSSFWSKPIYPNKQALQEAISQQLLQSFKHCPSVRSRQLTLPALSKHDWPWIQATANWILLLYQELDDRDLTYASLNVAPFGEFPALTTLDVHYCSQLRRLSREHMVVTLLKSASELEQYARHAEYQTATLLQMARSTFQHYQITPPTLPQPLPLTAYPLDFVPHQDQCPPWGLKVMEALNEVTALPQDGNSLSRARTAVQLVLDAFQTQHDEELSARLGRKNLQVMDRLAKMQAHKQACIETLHSSFDKSTQAQQAAQEVHAWALRQHCELEARHQVPLFHCSCLVKGATGTLYITATQLLIVTQLVPLVGGHTVYLWDLQGLEFEVLEATKSLLNPLPAGIIVRRGGHEVLLVRPSYMASRLKVFLDIVQAWLTPETEAHMYGDVTPGEGGEDVLNTII